MSDVRPPLRPDGSRRRPRAGRPYQGEAPQRGAWPAAQKRATRAARAMFEEPRPEKKREERPLVARPPRRLPLISLVTAAALGLALLFSIAQKNAARQQLDGLLAQRAAAEQKHQDDLAYYEGMRRRSGVMALIAKYAKEYQVEPAMVSAVIARESHYDPYAESSVGARGLMQIMEDTGAWIAGKLGVEGYTYQHLFDAELNIRFGTWYLSYLSDRMQGDPVMVASAYHAGLNNVNLWALKYADDGRLLTADQIPLDDTRDYVKKVMNAYALYYELEQAT